MNRVTIILVVIALAGIGYFVMRPTPKPAGWTPAPAIEEAAPSPQPKTAERRPAPTQSATPPQPQKMSEDEFREKLQSQFETSFKEGQAAEDASATAFFINETLKGFNLNERQKEQVNALIKDIDGQIERAANEAQKDRIFEEAGDRLRRIIGAPNP